MIAQVQPPPPPPAATKPAGLLELEWFRPPRAAASAAAAVAVAAVAADAAAANCTDVWKLQFVQFGGITKLILKQCTDVWKSVYIVKLYTNRARVFGSIRAVGRLGCVRLCALSI